MFFVRSGLGWKPLAVTTYPSNLTDDSANTYFLVLRTTLCSSARVINVLICLVCSLYVLENTKMSSLHDGLMGCSHHQHVRCRIVAGCNGIVGMVGKGCQDR